MWAYSKGNIGGFAKFFSIMMGSNSLLPYYAINSSLMLHYKYSLEELENMLPWEREIYIMFIEDHIKKKNESINNG